MVYWQCVRCGWYVLPVVTHFAVGFNANESVTATMRVGICDFPQLYRTVDRVLQKQLGLRCQLRAQQHKDNISIYFTLQQMGTSVAGGGRRIHSKWSNSYWISFDLVPTLAPTLATRDCHSCGGVFWQSDFQKTLLLSDARTHTVPHLANPLKRTRPSRLPKCTPSINIITYGYYCWTHSKTPK